MQRAPAHQQSPRGWLTVALTLNAAAALFVLLGALTSWAGPDPGETDASPMPVWALALVLGLIALSSVLGLRLQRTRPLVGRVLLAAPGALLLLMFAALAVALLMFRPTIQ